MSFKDLDEFFDDHLELPIGGKTYRIPPVSAKTGLKFQKMLSTGMAAFAGAELSGDDVKGIELDDDQEKSLYESALGAAYATMLDDGVSWPKVRHAGMTAFLYHAGNRVMAEEFWAAGEGSPKAPKKPQDRKPKTRSARQASRAS